MKMSFITKIFGGKKEEKAPTASEAMQKLRETEEMLIKKQDYLEKKIALETVRAKKNASKNKQVAIQALKRKKRYEKQQQQIDGTLIVIERQIDALDAANTNTAVLTIMGDAAEALEAAQKHLEVGDVHDMMDETAEQQDVAREISDAISNPVAFGEDVDEDELEQELKALEQEDEPLKVGPSVDKLPTVPQGEVVKTKAKKVEYDDDMKELEAWVP